MPGGAVVDMLAWLFLLCFPMVFSLFFIHHFLVTVFDMLAWAFLLGFPMVFSHSCITTIHLPRIHSENVIPTLGGNHIFAKPS
jgi:hypothetical protein